MEHAAAGDGVDVEPEQNQQRAQRRRDFGHIMHDAVNGILYKARGGKYWMRPQIGPNERGFSVVVCTECVERQRFVRKALQDCPDCLCEQVTSLVLRSRRMLHGAH
jgi:hypothetical protein